jgi:hypothetical protein
MRRLWQQGYRKRPAAMGRIRNLCLVDLSVGRVVSVAVLKLDRDLSANCSLSVWCARTPLITSSSWFPLKESTYL